MPIPWRQRLATGVGHDQNQRQPGYRLVACNASHAVNGARKLVGARLRSWQIFGKQRSIRQGPSEHALVLGLPRENPPLTVQQHHRSALAEIDRAIELDEIRLIERRGNDARETAVGVAQPPRCRGEPSVASRRKIGWRNIQAIVGAIALGDEMRHAGYIAAWRRVVIGMSELLPRTHRSIRWRPERMSSFAAGAGRHWLRRDRCIFPTGCFCGLPPLQAEHDRHPQMSVLHARRESSQSSGRRFFAAAILSRYRTSRSVRNRTIVTADSRTPSAASDNPGHCTSLR